MPSTILLITPEFYGVEKKIKFILEKSGYEVVYIENKILKFDYHSKNSKLRCLRRIYFFLYSPQVRYIRRQLKKFENIRFDTLLSINAFIICPYLFKRLKRKNPDLYSILYLWDSFSKYNWKKELRYFDRVLTFDPKDSKEFNLEYKPNFYISNNQQIDVCEKYDLFFIGKFHSFRLLMVEKIKNDIKNSDINFCIKLWPAYKIFPHHHLIYNLIKKIKFKGNWIKEYLLNYEAVEGKLNREYIISNSLSYVEMQHYLLCSNVVLDLPFKEQTGYSHRLIEALVNGKKIITTNANISEEEFFNAKQIRIMDIKKPELDCDWIKQRSNFQTARFLKNLELSKWLKSLVNVEIT